MAQARTPEEAGLKSIKLVEIQRLVFENALVSSFMNTLKQYGWEGQFNLTVEPRLSDNTVCLSATFMFMAPNMAGGEVETDVNPMEISKFDNYQIVPIATGYDAQTMEAYMPADSLKGIIIGVFSRAYLSTVNNTQNTMLAGVLNMCPEFKVAYRQFYNALPKPQ